MQGAHSDRYEPGTGTAQGTWGCKQCGCVVWNRDLHNATCPPDAVPAPEPTPRTYHQLTEQEGGPPNERIGEPPTPDPTGGVA